MKKILGLPSKAIMSTSLNERNDLVMDVSDYVHLTFVGSRQDELASLKNNWRYSRKIERLSRDTSREKHLVPHSNSNHIHIR
jgi:hypothetical protein